IPDLDETIALGVGATGRPAENLVAMIEEDFRARAARAGIAHGPEIVRAGDAQNPAVGKPGDCLPDIEGVVVVDIDGDQQALGRQREIPGDEIPGQFDRALLEIVAEREIAEHLEEGVVARGVADIVEIVVLAAGAHAFLRGDGAAIGALLEAGEDVLELHHAGIGEHQRRVVARHERRRRYRLMAVAGEEIDEALTDFVDAAHALIRSGPRIRLRAALSESRLPSPSRSRAGFSDQTPGRGTLNPRPAYCFAGSI